MAATIRQWEAVVQLLGRIDGSGSPNTHVTDLNKALDALRTQPTAPPEVWRQLVQQKVPLKLLKACAKTLQRLDGPSQAPATATRAANATANTLLAAAGRAGAVPKRNKNRETRSGSSSSGGGVEGAAGGASSSTASASTASASTSSAPNASFLLQLQQSGLLEQLPAALSAATQQLQRLVATAEAGRGDICSGKEETAQQMIAMALLELVHNLLLLPPEQNNGVALVPLPAVAGLILSSLRYLTCVAAAEAGQQQQQQGAWQRQDRTRFWLGLVNNAIKGLMQNISSVLSAFKNRKRSSTRVDSSSSSSSSSSAALPQATAAADVAVEQVLCSEECFLCLAVGTIGLAPHLAATQLPIQLTAVLQQASCSADVIVGLAQQLEDSKAFEQCSTAIKACVVFAHTQGHVPELLQGRQEQLGRFALLHKLMCAALLQLAHMFATLDLPQLRCCSHCCFAALSIVRQARRLIQLQAPGSSKSGSDSDSDSDGDSDNGSADNSGNPHQDSAEQQEHSFDYSSCLQSAQDLLQQLLQLWGSATAVLTAADAPVGLRLPGSSSGGSSSGAVDQASVPAVLQGADGPIVMRCISSTVNILSAALLPLLLDGEGSVQGANAGGQDAQTAVRLCSLLSQQTRASTEAVQVSSSSSTVALRQSGQLLASTLQAAAADLLHALPRIAKHSGLRLGKAICSYDLGSVQQRQLFDLQCSLLKLCSIDSNLLQQQPGFCWTGILRVVCYVAVTAGDRVAFNAKQVRACSAATHAAGTDAATASGAAAAAPPAELGTAAATAAQGSSTSCPSPTAMLPWLALLGRCCLLWAGWLQLLSVQLTEAGSADQWASQAVTSTWAVSRAAEAAPDPWSLLPGQYSMTPTPASKLHCVPARSGGTMDLSAVIRDAASSASVWLAAGSNMQQLADLGYNTQPLLAALVLLHADAIAIRTLSKGQGRAKLPASQDVTTQQQPNAERAAAEAIRSAERTSLTGLCPQLQVVGQALTAFAMPLACNNPGCVNASGPSEARLVGGKSCVCAGCLTARYCSRACLKQHWKVHKPVCKALAAAAGSKAAATVTTQHASG